MIAVKVVLFPISVTAECHSFTSGTSAEQIQARLAEAFQ